VRKPPLNTIPSTYPYRVLFILFKGVIFMVLILEVARCIYNIYVYYLWTFKSLFKITNIFDIFTCMLVHFYIDGYIVL
jgi:hypothetical protein